MDVVAKRAIFHRLTRSSHEEWSVYDWRRIIIGTLKLTHTPPDADSIDVILNHKYATNAVNDLVNCGALVGMGMPWSTDLSYATYRVDRGALEVWLAAGLLRLDV